MSRYALLIVSLACLGLAAPSAQAQRNLTEIPPPDPEIERRSFQVADGFEVNLYASDPLLAKPIQMNFDPAGRLWIASSEVYPHIQPGQKANDKILVLEDADGDGRAEKTTVFADGLLIPTGVEPGDGGCYVGASTELLHLADTDGDGKADRTRVMLSGFGTEDTHHIIHTLRWGYDGCLYFNQSIYIHSHVETPRGVRRLNGGGIWRFRPESMHLEVFAKGLINPWGHHFDRYGQSFATDGAGGEGINHVFPGAVFATSPGAERVVRGLNPGSPKFCGLEIVSGRHLPDDWQGNCITHDFRGHRVCRFKLSEAGSGFASHEEPELIKTSHVAFRPVDVKMGPDGAIYIADWYNPIIQHGEVDFRDPRRDHTHGRIWRVTCKDRPLVARPKLVNAKIDELFDALRAPEGWTRQQARRVLKERTADYERILEVARARFGEVKIVDTIEDWQFRLELMWLGQSLNRIELTQLNDLLDHSPLPEIRAAAIRVGSESIFGAGGLIQNNSFTARHPRVLLETILAARGRMNPVFFEALCESIHPPLDPNVDFAVWQSLREGADIWMPHLLNNPGLFRNRAISANLPFILATTESSEAAKIAAQRLGQSNIKPADMNALARLIGTHGGPDELAVVIDSIVGLRFDKPAEAAAVLRTIAETTAARGIRPSGSIDGMIQSYSSPSVEFVDALSGVVAAWRLEEALPTIVEVCLSTKISAARRTAALRALPELRGAQAKETLRKLATADAETVVRGSAIAALVRVDAQLAAQAFIQAASDESLALDPLPIVEAFLEQKDAAAKLIAALADARLPLDLAKRAVRAASSTAKPAPGLVEALRKAGGLGTAPRPLTPDEMRQLVALVADRGDAARGEAIYRRKDSACMKCHAIGGAGGLVGPDLSSIGGSAQLDYLIESILEPSKKIKENYHSVVVITKEGRTLTGVKLRQTERDLVIRNAEDQEVNIPLNSIDEQAAGQSLMPLGLVETLTRDEVADVVRFLAELGKVGGNYLVGRERVVRRWETLEASQEAIERLRRDRVAAAATNDAGLLWTPAYSNVAGELPIGELPWMEQRWQGYVTLPKVSLVRCELLATGSAKILLALNDPNGLSLWVDGKPVEVGKTVALDLAAGRHKLTWAIDRDKRNDLLRVELQDQTGLSQVQIVSGK